MIEKQPTSLTPSSASKEFAASLVDSLARRHDLSGKNTTKQVMKEWPNYADEVWHRHESEQERRSAEQAARSERLARPLYSESLHRKVILGTAAAVLAVGGVSAWTTSSYENDQASTTYDSDTVLTPKDWPVDHDGLNPPSGSLEKVQPDLPPAEYLPPKAPTSEYENPPGYNLMDDSDSGPLGVNPGPEPVEQGSDTAPNPNTGGSEPVSQDIAPPSYSDGR